MGELRLSTGCAGAGAGVKSTIWWGKKSRASNFFYPPWSSGSPGPLSLLWPLSGSRIRSVLLSYPALLRLPLPRNCRLSRTLLCFRNGVGCASDRLWCWVAISSSNTSPRPNRAFGNSPRIGIACVYSAQILPWVRVAGSWYSVTVWLEVIVLADIGALELWRH